ncbi:DEKNAAC100044 [Brettanomyces naardenensis]|uniref:DEKNAAC100044 n=1 Tax=Brettanomyces naardenensis TaxID=13370 RepID=A0A448YES4_BRENA|nr:DEKNAAC100044 [Brettanomyces naardenensis]
MGTKNVILSEPILPNSRKWSRKQRAIKIARAKYGDENWDDRRLARMGVTSDDMRQYYKRHPKLSSIEAGKLLRSIVIKQADTNNKKSMYSIALEAESRRNPMPSWYKVLRGKDDKTQVPDLISSLRKRIRNGTADKYVDGMASDLGKFLKQRLVSYSEEFNRYSGKQTSLEQCKQMIFSQSITNYATVVSRRQNEKSSIDSIAAIDILLSSEYPDLSISQLKSILRDAEYLETARILAGSNQQLPGCLHRNIFHLINSAIQRNIEITPVETHIWISYLMIEMTAGVEQTLTYIGKFHNLLNLNISHYNAILENASCKDWKLVIKQMSENRIVPDRVTILTLLDYFGTTRDVISLLRLTQLIFDVVRIDIDTELVEKLISAYANCEQPDTPFMLLVRLCQIFEQKKIPLNNGIADADIPLADKLALDSLLTRFGGRHNSTAILNHAIRPTRRMIQPLLGVCRVPGDTAVIEYLNKVSRTFQLD